MQLRFEIPEAFWSLFRSVNRETYIEALMAINEEYQYSNYFLTREVCIQVLRDLYMKKQIELKREEDETEFDMLETPSARILNWLIRKGWLKKIEDYNTLVTNIVIPDYAAILWMPLSGFLRRTWRRQRSISRMSMRHCSRLKMIRG